MLEFFPSASPVPFSSFLVTSFIGTVIAVFFQFFKDFFPTQGPHSCCAFCRDVLWSLFRWWTHLPFWSGYFTYSRSWHPVPHISPTNSVLALFKFPLRHWFISTLSVCLLTWLQFTFLKMCLFILDLSPQPKCRICQGQDYVFFKKIFIQFWKVTL